MGLAAISRTFSTNDIYRQAFQAFKIRQNYYSFHDSDNQALVTSANAQSQTDMTVRQGKSYYKSEFAQQVGLEPAAVCGDSFSQRNRDIFVGGNLGTVSVEGQTFALMPNLAPYVEGKTFQGKKVTSFMLVPVFSPSEVPQYPDITRIPRGTGLALFDLAKMIHREIPLNWLTINWSPFASILLDKDGRPLPPTQSIAGTLHVHCVPEVTSESTKESDRPMTPDEFESLRPSQLALLTDNDPLSVLLKQAILERLLVDKRLKNLELSAANGSDKASLRVNFNKPFSEIDSQTLDNVFRAYFGTLDFLSRGLTQAMLENGRELTGTYRQILKTEDPSELLGQMQREFSRIYTNPNLISSREIAVGKATELDIPENLIRQIYTDFRSPEEIAKGFKFGLGACAGLTIDAHSKVSFVGKAVGRTGPGASVEGLLGKLLKRNPKDTPSSAQERFYLAAQKNIWGGVKRAAKNGGGTVYESTLWKEVLY